MKRILILLSALVLIFAVACSGDNPAPGGNTDGVASQELVQKVMSIMMWTDESGNENVEATYLVESTYFDGNGKQLATQVSHGNGEPGSRAEITIYTPVEDIPAGSVIEAVIPEVEPPALPSYTPVYSFEGTPLSEEQDTALDQLFMTSAKVYRARRTTSRYTDMEYDGIVYSSWYHETMELTSTSTSALDYFQSYHKVKTTPDIDGMTSIEVYTENQTNICVITGGDYAGTYSVPLEILLQG